MLFRSTKRSIGLYEEQRAQKVEPAQIIAMLTWQLHVLAVIKAAGDRPVDQVAKEAKLNPFVVRKSQAVVKKLSIARLRSLVGDLLKIDIDSKTKGVDLDAALERYLLGLSST